MSIRNRTSLLGSPITIAATGAAAQDREFTPVTPVTSAMLANPDPADWLN